VQRESEKRSQKRPLLENKSLAVDLEPELRPLSSTSGHLIWTALDLVVSVNAVKLHLYDALASSEIQLKEHGIARFALNDNTLRLKILSDGASEAQVVLRSFTMSNTRPGQSKFREIIPAAQHNRNQFMLLYSMTGGMQGSSLAVLTVDSPQIIFAIDPVIYLLEFFTASSSTETDTSSIESPSTPGNPPSPGQAQVDFRVDLHDVSISVLEDDADPDSQAIRLYITQILLSKQVRNCNIIQILPHLRLIQGIVALTINRLGMSLMNMGRTSESVRFLDDVDLTVSLDSRSLQQMTNIEITAKSIIFRASYRDINLITSIVNKAIEVYGTPHDPDPHQIQPISSISRATQDPYLRTTRKARVSMSNEQVSHRTLSCSESNRSHKLKGSFDGFKLILIGDLHEQPMLHLKVKPFVVNARDWSGEVLLLSFI